MCRGIYVMFIEFTKNMYRSEPESGIFQENSFLRRVVYL